MRISFILGALVIVAGALPLIGFMPEILTQGNNYNYLIVALGALITVMGWLAPGGESIRESIRSRI
jgi:cytochrome c biogenesis protein CcdA